MKHIVYYVLGLLVVVLFMAVGEDDSGKTDEEKLVHAIMTNNINKVRYMVDGNLVGVNSIISIEYRKRPIHVAAYYSRDEIIKYLVDRGADINAIDGASGKTALSVAIWKGYESTAILLLDLGADPKIPNDVGVSPCLRAKRAGMQRVVNKIPDCV